MEHLFAGRAAGQQSWGWQDSRGSGPSAARGSGPAAPTPCPAHGGALGLEDPVPATVQAGAFVPALLGPRAAAGARGSGEKPVSLQPAWA